MASRLWMFAGTYFFIFGLSSLFGVSELGIQQIWAAPPPKLFHSLLGSSLSSSLGPTSKRSVLKSVFNGSSFRSRQDTLSSSSGQTSSSTALFGAVPSPASGQIQGPISSPMIGFRGYLAQKQIQNRKDLRNLSTIRSDSFFQRFIPQNAFAPIRSFARDSVLRAQVLPSAHSNTVEDTHHEKELYPDPIPNPLQDPWAYYAVMLGRAKDARKKGFSTFLIPENRPVLEKIIQDLTRRTQNSKAPKTAAEAERLLNLARILLQMNIPYADFVALALDWVSFIDPENYFGSERMNLAKVSLREFNWLLGVFGDSTLDLSQDPLSVLDVPGGFLYVTDESLSIRQINQLGPLLPLELTTQSKDAEGVLLSPSNYARHDLLHAAKKVRYWDGNRTVAYGGQLERESRLLNQAILDLSLTEPKQENQRLADTVDKLIFEMVHVRAEILTFKHLVQYLSRPSERIFSSITDQVTEQLATEFYFHYPDQAIDIDELDQKSKLQYFQEIDSYFGVTEAKEWLINTASRLSNTTE